MVEASRVLKDFTQSLNVYTNTECTHNIVFHSKNKDAEPYHTQDIQDYYSTLADVQDAHFISVTFRS
jgi:hypothetical protein